jgi:hypothetical protein
MKSRIRCAVMVLALAGLWVGDEARAAESDYATGTTSETLVFGAGNGRRTVRSIYATTDKAASVIKIYGWNGVAAKSPSVAPTASTNVFLTNTGYAITNSDVIVYEYASGLAAARTVAVAEETWISLTAALPAAGSTSDRIYEVAQNAQLKYASTSAATNAPENGKFEGVVYEGPGPLYLIQDSTAAGTLNATVD